MKILPVFLCAALALSSAPTLAASSPPRAETAESVKADMKDQMVKLKSQLKDQAAKLRAAQKDQMVKLKTDQKQQIAKLKADQKVRWQKFKEQSDAADATPAFVKKTRN